MTHFPVARRPCVEQNSGIFQAQLQSRRSWRAGNLSVSSSDNNDNKVIVDEQHKAVFKPVGSNLLSSLFSTSREQVFVVGPVVALLDRGFSLVELVVVLLGSA